MLATASDPLRPTFVEIDLARLAENLHLIRQKVTPAKVMPVVKANAYGHGLVPVAQHMLANGADALGVAILDEGIALRQAGISAPVLVFGGVLDYQVPAYLQHNLTLTVTCVENLQGIDEAARKMRTKAKVHIKVDTGMGRLGVPYYEAEKLLEASLHCAYVQVEGIYSHFANADAADLSYASLQVERFNHVLTFYEKRGLPYPVRHMANSGAILQLPEAYFDLVRPGIMLYGVYPSKETRRTVLVRPALTWKTHAVYSKVIPANYPVSYGSTWQSDHAVRILTLPLGYGDGYFRSLSNRGQVIVGGKKVPIVGRVCMDQCMVNLEDDTAEAGEEVLLLGEGQEQAITADDLADLVGTIPYEILTNINGRVPRVYVNYLESTGLNGE
jgi:alanine racemase